MMAEVGGKRPRHLFNVGAVMEIISIDISLIERIG
jgi:hypothetical protein